MVTTAFVLLLTTSCVECICLMGEPEIQPLVPLVSCSVQILFLFL